MPSETVTRVIAKKRVHREKFERFCRSLSEEELERPVPDSDWRVKDFIIHLATFDTEFIRWLEGAKQGEPDTAAKNPDGSRFDIDEWNNRQAAARRDWPLERLLSEAAANRARLERLLETLEESDVQKTWHFAGDNKRPPAEVPLGLFLNGVTRHDPIHVADMIKALPERADNPEIKAWLDDSVVNWYQTTMAGPPRR